MNAAPDTNATATVATNDIRPAKTIVEIPGAASALILAAIGAIVFMTALAVYLRIRRGRSDTAKRPPHVIAREQLIRSLELMGDPRLYCIAVSDIMRRYFESCLRLSTTEQTTEEFLRGLENSPWLKPVQKNRFSELLAVCDLAKFAKYDSHPEEMQALHTTALKWVEETELHSFRSADEQPVPIPAKSNHPA